MNSTPPSNDMLTPVNSALATIQSVSAVHQLATETVPLECAAGRVLTSAIISSINLPPFDNSAMDGFALPDSVGLAEGRCELDVAGELAAGADPTRVASDAVIAVMTGAALPPGIFGVVAIESVDILARNAAGQITRIRLRQPIRAGQNCRRAGQDVALGDQVLPACHRLRTSDLPLLRGIGIEKLNVWARPRVAVLCTGAELVAPGHQLGAGQIYDSNGLAMTLTLETAGAEVIFCDRIADDPSAFREALVSATSAKADIVVSTGAVSMGLYDFVPQALEELGATQHFHKLAMRPGKPLLFATLPTGACYFGLPGNPVSSLVGARFFVNAAIRTMLGLSPEVPRLLPLSAAVSEKPRLTMYQKARLVHEPGKSTQVERLAGQESFRLAPLLSADAWAVLPAEEAHMPSGSLVEVYPLEPFGW